MSKTILLVLTGDPNSGETDHYQVLQEQEARSEAAAGGLQLEVVFATGFDHLRVIRKRLREEGQLPVDAVIVEPSTSSSAVLLLKQLKGTTGLVLLNAWAPEVEEFAREWGSLPFGTVSTDHLGIGRIQGRQTNALLPEGGQILCVTGPPGSSAAVQRLEGLRSVVGDRPLFEAAAGYWTELDGGAAFDRWYGIYRKRAFRVDVIAAQSDELAMGVKRAAEALTDPAHREMLTKAPLLGVDAVPAFGRKLVDEGTLRASVTTPANTGEAIRHLRRFWEMKRPLPLQALTEPTPYPPASAGRS